MSDEHAIDLAAEPREARAALTKAAEMWGAELDATETAGRLRLPVQAGLRRGWIEGGLAIELAPEGSRLTFRPASADYSLQISLVALLVLGAAGAALVVLWPFYPPLLPIAPFGAIVALATWFLGLARLRSAGPEEFLETVAAVVGEGKEKTEAEGSGKG